MINFESPLYVNVVLCTIYTLIVLATAATVWSAVRTLRLARLTTHRARMWSRASIAITAALLAGLLAITYLTGSTDSIVVNGQPYTDAFWLRISDMFLGTAIALIGIALVAVVVSRIAGTGGGLLSNIK